MLSYQHAYHAGGYADVIKHFILERILRYMVLKDKGILYIETHAGRGQYDLNDAFSKKTGEALEGIHQIWSDKHNSPSVLDGYLSLLKQQNTKELIFYPGSPWIAANILRPQDRLCAFELHKTEFEHLQTLKNQHPKLQLACKDGMSMLNALLPPTEKRALIFIDPSYEIKTEYQDIPQILVKAYTKFKQGVYCIWYPILASQAHLTLIQGLQQLQAEKILHLEFMQNSTQAMHGTGLFIINPPYTLANEAKITFEYFKKVFNPGKSTYHIQEHN